MAKKSVELAYSAALLLCVTLFPKQKKKLNGMSLEDLEEAVNGSDLDLANMIDDDTSFDDEEVEATADTVVDALAAKKKVVLIDDREAEEEEEEEDCLLYTSPSPRDRQKSRMPSSA